MTYYKMTSSTTDKGNDMRRVCYRCEDDLTESNSHLEHIIPNACGGRLKSRDLLCVTCGSKFGEDIDNALAVQCNDLANLLMIRRDRGEPQPIRGKTADGQEYKLMLGGVPAMVRPYFDEKADGDKISITIQARSMKEFKDMLKGVKGKYPELDIEAALSSAQHREEYLNEAVSFQTAVGGDEVFRGVMKMVIEYYLYLGGERKYIAHQLPYLNGSEKRNDVWMHYPVPAPYSYAAEEVSNVIHLVGDPNHRILYAYVELFNTRNFILRINTEYDGAELFETYVSDLLARQDLDRKISLAYSRDQLNNLFEDKDAKPFDQVRTRLNRVVAIGLSRQREKETSDLIEASMEEAFGRPDGSPITPAMLDSLAQALAKRFAPILVRRSKGDSAEPL